MLAVPHRVAGGRQQLPVWQRLGAVHVPAEEIVGKARVTTHRRQGRLRVGERIWARHVAGRLSTRGAVHLPQLPHVVVQRDAAVAALAQRQVQPQRDRGTIRVIGNERVLPVGRVDGLGCVDVWRQAAHVDGRPELRARCPQDTGGEHGQLRRTLILGDQSRTDHRQHAVIAGESLGEPQLARHVRLREVERLERRRPDAFHVPRMEELVRRGAGHARHAVGQRRGGGADGAVAVFHPVAVGPRQVVHQERVRAGIEGRQIAEDGGLLAHDLLHHRRVRIELRVGPEVVHGEPDACRRAAARPSDRELRTAWALNSTGESMKYWKFGAVNVRGSSVGNSCVETRQVRPGGWVKRTRIGVSGSDGVQAKVAGAFR